jgi:hypothetical protein
MVLLPKRSAEHFEAFRSVSKHFESLQIGISTPAITAHNYPRRACRADFTRAHGGQGSLTAKRRGAGAALTARGAVVTKIPIARPPGLFVHDCRHELGSARFGSFSAWGVTGISFGILLVFCWSRWYELVRVGICWPCWYSPKLINGLECECGL